MDLESSWKALAPSKKDIGREINSEVIIHNMMTVLQKLLKLITA